MPRNNKQTSKEVAHKGSEAMRDDKATKREKTLGGSVVSQAPLKPKGK